MVKIRVSYETIYVIHVQYKNYVTHKKSIVYRIAKAGDTYAFMLLCLVAIAQKPAGQVVHTLMPKVGYFVRQTKQQNCHTIHCLIL